MPQRELPPRSYLTLNVPKDVPLEINVGDKIKIGQTNFDVKVVSSGTDWTYRQLLLQAVTRKKRVCIPFERYGSLDKYGRKWPKDYIVCSTCGQPDNCGDCTHDRITDEQAQELME